MRESKAVIRMTLDMELDIARALDKEAQKRGVGRRVVVKDALLHYFEYLRQQGRNGQEPEV